MPKIVYPDKPEWGPLEKVVGEKCKNFMFMGMVAIGEIWVFLYKHVDTRRYLNLDGMSRAYASTNGKYSPVEIEQALEWVFA
ncbi:hypothetical protein Psfp_02358 [Pelotomaculum sp. FP]|uniref:hypothetical protein n=1 Tax=Pelotomaculum sp. FP TaxID=261474 RepID=UPI0010655B9E|nr:hypothetical protein [Pelotomaculum sp. FP]TEB15182.1 hypothetical protein Psfp_02358 [Pelotomaculum sp. FP]